MAVTVEDMRIDGKSVDDGILRITSRNPIFTWAYGLGNTVLPSTPPGDDSSISKLSPKGYEIRIGTLPNNLGTDLFSGDITSTGSSQIAANRWALVSRSLVRGSTYYGQVRLRSEGDFLSSWKTFVFKMNSLPSVSSVQILPRQSSGSLPLELHYIFEDADGDADSGTKVHWYLDGIHQYKFDGMKNINASRGEWTAHVFPNDGYEFGDSVWALPATVKPERPSVSSARIIPSSPTPDDVLCIDFFSETAENANVNWYVNNELVSTEKSLMKRLNLEEGDVVFASVEPLAENVGGDVFETEKVTVVERKPVVSQLKLIGNSSSDDNSLLSWTSSAASPTRTRIGIGTSPGSSNILLHEGDYEGNTFQIPSGILKNGFDYFASVQLGTDEGFGNKAYTSFRFSGNAWSSVSNLTGWTMEASVELRPNKDDEGNIIDGFQSISIADGSKSLEVRLYPSQIRCISGTDKDEVYDLSTDKFVLTIWAKENDYQVAVNRNKVIDGSGKLLRTTTAKEIKIGTAGENTNLPATWRFFGFTTDGSYAPSSQKYLNVTFQDLFKIRGSVESIDSSISETVFAVSKEGEPSDIYRFEDGRYQTFRPSVEESFDTRRLDSSGQNTVISYPSGATVIRGLPDSSIMTNVPLNSEPDNMSIIAHPLSSVTWGSGVEISTETDGGQWFMSQGLPGTDWYDHSDNESGWTVDFLIDVERIKDSSGASSRDNIDGIGLYVNDGTIWEIIDVDESKLYFRRAGNSFNLIEGATRYRLLCRRMRMTLYAEVGDVWTNVGDINPLSGANPGGFGRSPSVMEDDSGNWHAVWIDSSGPRNYVFYNNALNGEWQSPSIVASGDEDFDRPSLVQSNGRIYCFFEMGTSVGYNVISQSGWAEFRIVNTIPSHSRQPSCTSTLDGTIHVAYCDTSGPHDVIRHVSRGPEGVWSQPEACSFELSSADSPSLSSDGNVVFCTYRSGTNIKASVLKDEGWTGGANVSDSLVNHIGRPSSTCGDGTLFVAWHGIDNLGADIFVRRIDENLSFLDQETRLTLSGSRPNFNPSIGYRTGDDGRTGNAYVFWSGTGGDNRENWTDDDGIIRSAMYSSSIDAWLSENSTFTGSTTFGGFNVTLTTTDETNAVSPFVAPTFSMNAPVVFESTPAPKAPPVSGELTPDKYFTDIHIFEYDLSYVSTHPIESHLQVSSSGPKREIRIGEFSDSRDALMSIKHFSYGFTPVRPFLISTIDEPSHASVIGDEGDSYIAGEKGLILYRRDSDVYHQVESGRLAGKAITGIDVDENGVMYLAAGQVYASLDHRNFYLKYPEITNVNDVSSSNDGRLWIATNEGLYWVTKEAIISESDDSYDGQIADPEESDSSSGGNEIISYYSAGYTLYAMVLDQSGRVWDGNSFTSIDEADRSDSIVPMEEQSFAGIYFGSFPPSITVPGKYHVVVFNQEGSEPDQQDLIIAETDIDWDGNSQIGEPEPAAPTADAGVGNVPSGIDLGVFNCFDGQYGYVRYHIGCGLPSNNVKRVRVDSTDRAWAATPKGLASAKDTILITYTTNNSNIPSASVNDIAPLDAYRRLVSTDGGLVLMYGSEFELVDGSAVSATSSCSYLGEDLAWALGGGNLFLLKVTGHGVKTLYVAGTSTYAPNEIETEEECQSFTRYAISVPPIGSIADVLVNGRSVACGWTFSSETGQLAFESPLFPSDTVEVRIYDGIKKIATLYPNPAEKMFQNPGVRKVADMSLKGSDLFVGTTGDSSQWLKADISSQDSLPSDDIVLDTTPPKGCMEFVEQISRRRVSLRIPDAFDALSGLSDMRVSNYPNMTSDGENELPWTPFKSSFEHDLGTDFGNVNTEISFSGTSGSSVEYFSEGYVVATSLPAQIWKNVENEWIKVTDIEEGTPNTKIHFVKVFGDLVFIGTGSDGGTAKVFSSADGITFNQVGVLGGEHASSASVIGGQLYVGTSSTTEPGKVYRVNGSGIELVYSGIGSSVDSLAEGRDEGEIRIMAGSGGAEARVYRINPNRDPVTAQIMYSYGDDTFSAMGSGEFVVQTRQTTAPDDDFVLFAGLSSNGRVFKSINGGPFVPSFTTIPTRTNMIKRDSDGNVWMSIGTTLYKNVKRAWEAFYSHTEDILDFSIVQNKAMVISENRLSFVDDEKNFKNVYLQLRDLAGNESNVYGGEGCDLLAIEITDLEGFTHSNRLLELDQFGQEIWNYESGDPFFSGGKVEEERAEYFSEVFNASSDQLAWDQIYWDAIVPDGTDLYVEVRTATSREAILFAPWVKKFGKDEFEGGDISSLSGQFIQFRVTMSSTIRNLSPKLFSINISGYARASVHFFTTNFVLPSRAKSALITSETFVPVAADVIFGIDTNDSNDFSDYQIVEPERIFGIAEEQQGKNIKVGVKLISPLPYNVEANPTLPSSDHVNVIRTSFTAPNDGTYFFRSDFSLGGSVQTSVYSGSEPGAFRINGTVADSEGLEMTSGEVAQILIAGKGNAAVRCGEEYEINVVAVDSNEQTNSIITTETFTATCSPRYVDDFEFDFTNNGSTNNFHFRVTLYRDPTRIDQDSSFFTALDQTGWLADGSAFPSGGVNIVGGETSTIKFTPSINDNDPIRYIDVEVYDGNSFTLIDGQSHVFIRPTSNIGCGPYEDVPVLKNLAIQFELEEFEETFGSRKRSRRTVQLNI